MTSKGKDNNILSSGASVAGLTTAWWLARYGFKVTVVERAPHLRPGGQALDVRGPAVAVAKHMRILTDIRDRSTKLTGVSLMDAEGKEIYRSTQRTVTGGRFDSPDVGILRDALCEVLYDAVGDRVEFLFDDRVTSIIQDETGVNVAFANAAPRRFALLIGADGLHSGVRRLVFGPEQQFLRFVGFHIAVFAAPNFLGLDHWQIFHEHGNLMSGMLAMDKDAKARIYLGFGMAEPLDYDYRDIAAQKRLVTERFAGDKGDVLAGISRYEHELRDYIIRNQDLALDVADTASQEMSFGQSTDTDSTTQPDGIPDFGAMIQPIDLKNYREIVQ